MSNWNEHDKHSVLQSEQENRCNLHEQVDKQEKPRYNDMTNEALTTTTDFSRLDNDRR